MRDYNYFAKEQINIYKNDAEDLLDLLSDAEAGLSEHGGRDEDFARVKELKTILRHKLGYKAGVDYEVEIEPPTEPVRFMADVIDWTSRICWGDTPFLKQLPPKPPAPSGEFKHVRIQWWMQDE